MRGHKITILGNPSDPNDASTKAYRDSEIAKIPSGGSVNAAILTKTTPQTFAGTIRVPDTNLSQITAKDVANIQFLQTYYLSKLAGGVMQNNIQFNESLADNRRQVLYLGDPTDPTSAINKKYFEDKLEQSHLVSSHKSNEFKYLIDSDESSSEYNITVNGIVDFNQSPHQNKKAYDITLIKDSGRNDYRSRIGFNIHPLAIGTYTIVFEFYPPELTNIQLSCDASEAYIHKAVQRDFTAYSKLLVQFNNNNKQSPDYIYLTMHGTASATPVQCHLVVYGVKDWSDSVYPGAYDGLDNVMFEYKNGDMEMKTDIDMNNKKLKNLTAPVDDNDAVNKLSLDFVSWHVNNHNYRRIFGLNFYDLIETARFNLIQGVSGVVINGVLPNFVLETDRFITEYSQINGLKLSTKTHIHTTKIFNQTSSFTFFMSFLHDETKTGTITWGLHIQFYPRFQITADQIKSDFRTEIQSISFTNEYKNKQQCIWICYDSSQRLYKMALTNYNAHINKTISPPVTFQSNQFEIDYEVFVNKIGFIDRFIDINSLDFHRILLGEKRNGSYVV